MIYEVRVRFDEPIGSEVEPRVHAFGNYLSREEAQARMEKEQARLVALYERKKDRTWEAWIEEIDQTGMFEIPAKPTPRERYSTRVTSTPRANGWPGSQVTVLDGEREVGQFSRNYASNPFEPFRQGARDFALISPDYTATSVMDLATGEIIASEPRAMWGFCPVGFYVPDWWDIHDDSIKPGSTYWDSDNELPRGDFGFVWGCVWGDDNGWKVQYLDLSQVADGIIARDDRFGYVELATDHRLDPSDFISYWPEGNSVQFSIKKTYDLGTGKPRSED